MRFDSVQRFGGWLCEDGATQYLRLDNELWDVAWWQVVSDELVRVEESGELETMFTQGEV